MDTTSREDIYNILRNALVNLFEIEADKISLAADLYEDLGIDSIDAIDLIDHIKKQTGHRLKADDFRNVRTLEDVIDAVLRNSSTNDR